MMYALALLCLFVTLYDLWYRRVPNWITYPLILSGFVANFPGAPALWFGSTLLLTAWGSGWMGGGDVKLWIGLLWCAFSFSGESVALIMFVTLIVTGLFQILVRVLGKKKDIMGIKLPGAWRSLAFLIFLFFHPATELYYVSF
jgi:Flp pilus assembly protein protease CpaA